PQSTAEQTVQNWRALVRPFQTPDDAKATTQLLNTFLPFLALWTTMYFSLQWSYALTLLLAVPAGGLLLRVFVLQHDCGHQSLFNDRRVNHAVGFFSSFFTTIPYKFWRMSHSGHHAHNAQLERRGLGDDVFYLTTEEYGALSQWGRRRYRIMRSPLLQFVLIPFLYFTVSLRLPFLKLDRWPQVRRSYLINNLLLVVFYGALAATLGWRELLMVQVPIMVCFGFLCFWLFYMQHQHEENYRAPRNEWEHELAAVQGSSYYKLPRVLQWFSASIGFHHIHHLNSRIPNYHLSACAAANPSLNAAACQITLRSSLKCVNNKLWCADTRRMITFAEYARRG
ncbi:MAG: fatty acid desaturase, partial [Catalinimonas sp.]